MHTYTANRTGDRSPTDLNAKLTALLRVVGTTTRTPGAATRGVGAKPLGDATSSRLAQIIALGSVVVQALPLDALDLGFRSLAGAPVDNIDNIW